MIGKMRQRVTLYRISETTDNQGGATETEVKVCDMWASFKQLSGSRAIYYKQVSNEVAYEMIIRYTSIDTEVNFVRYKDKDYIFDEIVNVDERNNYLKCILRAKR